jgi:hypothetical protein
MTTVNDITEISQVILMERQGRDRGWFEQMEECLHPDSRIRISWFDGTGTEFVRRSREAAAAGIRPTHRLSPPVVHLHGDRSVAEVPAEISLLRDVGGFNAYIVSYTRLLYRLERREGAWKISAIDAIYERDTLVPTVYGAPLKLDPEILAKFRRPYMYLAYLLREAGNSVRDDLYGDDRPDEVNGLYQSAFDWMHG